MEILLLVGDNVNGKLFAFGIFALVLVLLCSTVSAADNSLNIRLKSAELINRSAENSITFRDGDYARIDMTVCVDSTSQAYVQPEYVTVYGKIKSYGERPDGSTKDFGESAEGSARIPVDGCRNFKFDLPGAASSEFDKYRDVIYLRFADDSYGEGYKMLTAVVEQAESKTAAPKCSDLRFNASDFSINENSTKTAYIPFYNGNQDYTFVVEGVDALAYGSSLVSFKNAGGSNFNISPGQTKSIKMNVTAGSVDSDTTVEAYAVAKGRFGGTDVYCEYNDIDFGWFDVTVLNDYTPPAYLDCGDISITTQDFSMNEGTSQTRTFSIKNSGTKSFSANIGVSEDYGSFAVTGYNSTLSVPAGSTRNFDVTIKGGSVSATSNGRAKINVSGNCTGSIPSKYFKVTVYDTATPPGYPACGDIKINTWNVTLGEDISGQVLDDFYIYNGADEAFRITSLSVYDNSGYFFADEGSYDDYIGAGQRGDFDVEVDTYEVSGDRSGTVYVKVTGEFPNSGRTCSYSNIGEDSFTITVDDRYDGDDYYDYDRSPYCGEMEWITGTKTIDEGTEETVTFRLQNNSDYTFYLEGVYITESGSFDAELVGNYTDERIYADDEIDVKVKIDADYVSGTKWGTVTLKAKGYFMRNGKKMCYYNDISEAASIKILNSGSSSDNGARCSGISLNTKDFFVEERDSEEKTFYLENNSGRYFIIDRVSVERLRGAFSVRLSGGDYDDKKVYDNQNARIEVTVKGNSVNYSDKSGRAKLKVEGHFSNGEKCYYSDLYEYFDVTVWDSKDESRDSGNDEGNGNDYTSSECADFKINVPNQITFTGTSGVIEVSVTNPMNYEATVSLSGAGLDIVPDEFTVGANNTTSKTLRVSSGKEEAFLIFKTEVNGCNIADRTTKIYFMQEEGNDEEDNGYDYGNGVEVRTAPTSMKFSGKGDVVITVENTSSEEMEVRFWLEGFPEDWESTEGTKTVAAGDSADITASITPTTEGTFTGKMIVEAGGKSIEKTLTLTVEPMENFFSSGFAVLADNAVVIGLLVIIVLLVLMIIYIQARR